MKFINENTGWATGDYSTIIKTTDGGANWITENSGIASIYTKFSCINTFDNSGEVCWITGFGGLILKTVDGGLNWETYQSVAVPQGIDLWSVYFNDNNTGWVSGTDGTIIRTTNGGNSWLNTGGNLTNETIIDLYFSSLNNGWAVGHHGKILNTTNSGINWSLQNSNTQDNLFNVHFRNDLTGWVAGDNGIIKTTNGGDTWQLSFEFPWMYSVFFIDENTGWAGGRFGKLVKTTNGGNNWTDQTGGTGATYYSIKFSDQSSGWAVGDYNTIIRTSDGGESWTRQLNGIDNIYLKLSEIFIAEDDGNTAWISGYYGYVFKTTNAGVNWYRSDVPQNVNYNSIIFSSENIGYAVGSSGIIIKTLNRGITSAGNDPVTLIPGSHVLYQNYPNPFNPKTTIKFSIPVQGITSLKVFDILGNEVKTLVNDFRNAGEHTVVFDGVGIASGIYFYKLVSGEFAETKRMILLK